MKTMHSALTLAAIVSLSWSNRAADTFGRGADTFDIEFVSIGDPGNAADTTGNPNPAGAVDYVYNIGKYEISRDMIERANAEGGLGITLRDMTNHGGNGPNQPATGVTWFEAATFVNWLNASSGYPEAYRYTGGDFELWEAGDAGYDAANPFRNKLAHYFLPNVHEWYKAAYYDPQEGVYYEFPTGSDTLPTPVASGAEPDTAVYFQDFNAGPAEITSAGGLSAFGTMALGGNVWEWEETEFDLFNDDSTSLRGVRGGDWDEDFGPNSDATRRYGDAPSNGGFDNVGFRVARIPEPSSLLLGALASMGVLLWRRRRGAPIRRPNGRNWRTTLLVGVLTTIVMSDPTYAQPGQVVNTRLTSRALEGNKLGDSATRSARVYLPPSYETSTRSYPVAYYLHGLSGNQNEFFSDQGHLSADGLIQAGMMDEMIIVGVDGRGGQPATGYLNSDLNGDYEDYIARDLVDHIDATFRTIADRDSRAIFGASYGGQATLYYAMMHSDVFGAAYAVSSGIVTSFSRPGSFLYLGGERAEFADFANAGNDLAGVETPSDIQGFLRSAVFGMASAHSPNLGNPPLHVDLPFEVPSLAIIPEVRDKWLEYDLFLLLEDRVSELSSLRGLALDVGDRDSANIRENTAFHEALVEASVPHQFEVFSGGHRDKRSERIRESLAFLSESLIVLFGDFNGNSTLDIEDIDLLSAEVRQRTNNPAMDVTGDGVVDELDHRFWVKDREIAFTYFGDANLDGEFNSGDLVAVFTAGEYEDGIANNSGWAEGDWNGDAEFDSGDLVAAFQDGGYELGSRAAMRAVPEPASLVMLLAGLIGISCHKRNVCRNVSR